MLRSVVGLISLVLGLFILLDSQAGIMHLIGILPFAHGSFQLLLPKRNLNVAEIIVCILYFIRNVFTPYMMSITNYSTPLVQIKKEDQLLSSIFIFIFETACVFIFIRKRTVKKVQIQKRIDNNSLRTGLLFNTLFWGGFLLTIIIYTLVPQTHDTFISIFDDEAAFLNAIMSDEVAKVGGINRILYTLFGILFGFYRILLPAYLLTIIRKCVKYSILAIPLSFFVISLQLFFITDRMMSTLIIISVLSMFLVYLYPLQKKQLFYSAFVSLSLLLPLFFVLKTSNGSSDLNSTNTLISFMFQSYLPNISNMVGVYNMPSWNLSYFIGDIYSMIPFRNSIFGSIELDNVPDLFNECNDIRGQIIPLVGQSYYHFGFLLCPILSLLLAKISFVSYEKSQETNNFVKYIYYIYLSMFAAMTPCMYYFGVFGSTYLTSMIFILIMSKFVTEKKSYGTVRK